MTTIAEYYARGNALWPAELPPLTYPEAVRAARKLYRFALKRKCPWEFRQVNGRLSTWVHGGVMNINVAGGFLHPGWKDIAHSLAHLCHNRIPNHDKPHSRQHARLEIRMVKEVLKRGWLTGVLKDQVKAPKPAASADVVKLQRIDARVVAWERRKKRAERALRKLARQQRYYQRKQELAA